MTVGFVVRRLFSGLLLLFGLTLITFVIYFKIPADPGQYFAGPGATQEQIAVIDRKLGIDKPVLAQYKDYVWKIVRYGDFGDSFTGTPISKTLKEVAPVTISLVVGGALVLLLLAFPLALISARYAQTWIDRTILLVSIFGIALHPFVVGAILRNVFAVHLKVLPYGVYCPLRGTATELVQNPNGTPVTLNYAPPTCGGPRDWAVHLLLPWITFAFFFLPLYVRMIRARLLETMSEPYVMTARAKGASEGRVLRKHVLKIALLPITTMLAMDMGTALTAAIYVETVFGLRGLGLAVVQAINGQTFYDLPLIVAVVFVVAATIVVLTLIVDLAYGFLDPRIRLRGSEAA
jgi:peptide/nickel transport system permease protein